MRSPMGSDWRLALCRSGKASLFVLGVCWTRLLRGGSFRGWNGWRSYFRFLTLSTQPFTRNVNDVEYRSFQNSERGANGRGWLWHLSVLDIFPRPQFITATEWDMKKMQSVIINQFPNAEVAPRQILNYEKCELFLTPMALNYRNFCSRSLARLIWKMYELHPRRTCIMLDNLWDEMTTIGGAKAGLIVAMCMWWALI